MLQFWMKIIFLLSLLVSCMQKIDCMYENIDDYDAPEVIKDALREVDPFVKLLYQSDTDGNVTRRCCEVYGCFSSESSAECQDITLLPSCQNDLQIKFYLWTKNNPVEYDVISLEANETLYGSNMVKNSSVVIYINGYLERGDMPYLLLIKDAMLNNQPDIMFVSVDWTNGSRTPFDRAVANAQMVASVTARFIQQLQKDYEIYLDRLHIIGINIGAHAAGAVGKRIPGIGRITGLDPVGWRKPNCHGIVDISLTDAKFVDIIHTNARTFGTRTPEGHLDIYINGALDQPACGGLPGCNHTIVVLYFLETIQKDLPYLAYQCDSYENFLSGKCAKGCNELGNCAPMGYRAREWECHAWDSPTLMFMSMGTDPSHFHLYHYHVEITCEDYRIYLSRYGRNRDRMEIKLIGENDTDTGFQEVHKESITYNSQPKITAIITSKQEIGKIKKAVLKWIPYENTNVEFEQCSDGNGLTSNQCADRSEKADCSCAKCPYKLKSLTTKNFETGRSTTFSALNVTLTPNNEVEIGCQE